MILETDHGRPRNEMGERRHRISGISEPGDWRSQTGETKAPRHGKFKYWRLEIKDERSEHESWLVQARVKTIAAEMV